jgi:hypothetical protein
MLSVDMLAFPVTGSIFLFRQISWIKIILIASARLNTIPAGYCMANPIPDWGALCQPGIV